MKDIVVPSKNLPSLGEIRAEPRKIGTPPRPPMPTEPPLSDTGRSRPWSDEEWAWCKYALDYMPHRGRVHHLRINVMPWRTSQQVSNGINVLRRNTLRICASGCGTPVTAKGRRCDDCKKRAREQRQSRVANGLCASCGGDLNEPGSSGTRCAECRVRRRKYAPKSTTRFLARTAKLSKPKDPRDASRRVIPWPACGHIKWAVKLMAPTKRPVVDLFGGSGEPLRLLHAYGGNPHTYNDIHQGLVALMTAAKVGNRFTLAKHVKRLMEIPFDQLVQQYEASTGIELAAATVALARRTFNFTERTPKTKVVVFDNTLTASMKHLEMALQNTRILGRDALMLLKQPEQFPHDTIFLVDPPWPGCTQQFEDAPDFAELMVYLLDLPMEQDYVLMLGSERVAIQLAAKHMRQAPLHWRTYGNLFSKSLISLSPQLARETSNIDLGIPVNFKKLGL